MLVCSVHYFFPKPIRVTWLRNGKEVTSDVTSTEKLSNGDWHYQIHSYLEFTPVPGEKITCMVEHAHLMKPKLCEWGRKSDRLFWVKCYPATFLLIRVIEMCAKCVFRSENWSRVREQQDCCRDSGAAAGSGVFCCWADLLQEENLWWETHTLYQILPSYLKTIKTQTYSLSQTVCFFLVTPCVRLRLFLLLVPVFSLLFDYLSVLPSLLCPVLGISLACI